MSRILGTLVAFLFLVTLIGYLIVRAVWGERGSLAWFEE